MIGHKHTASSTHTLQTSQVPGKYHRIAGLSYIEVLIAIALIMVTLIPAIEALGPAVQGSGLHESQTGRQYALRAKLENILAQSFSTLDNEAQAINDHTIASTTFSDPATESERQLVFLSRYDGDNMDPADNDPFSDTDAGLLWIRIELEGTGYAIETLTSEYE
jgi:hypothetical protein